ncbi:hypothetical protein [Weissella diestrammenae]|nr:hypothetical protein [Weissella diestrammenae]MCM0582828.1 hypothetical protein [Weissella diestrammenae]
MVPGVWDTANSSNLGKRTVAHWSELGGISTAFYDGWSCDYHRDGTWVDVGSVKNVD